MINQLKKYTHYEEKLLKCIVPLTVKHVGISALKSNESVVFFGSQAYICRRKYR